MKRWTKQRISFSRTVKFQQKLQVNLQCQTLLISNVWNTFFTVTLRAISFQLWVCCHQALSLKSSTSVANATVKVLNERPPWYRYVTACLVCLHTFLNSDLSSGKPNTMQGTSLHERPPLFRVDLHRKRIRSLAFRSVLLQICKNRLTLTQPCQMCASIPIYKTQKNYLKQTFQGFRPVTSARFNTTFTNKNLARFLKFHDRIIQVLSKQQMYHFMEKYRTNCCHGFLLTNEAFLKMISSQKFQCYYESSYDDFSMRVTMLAMLPLAPEISDIPRWKSVKTMKPEIPEQHGTANRIQFSYRLYGPFKHLPSTQKQLLIQMCV